MSKTRYSRSNPGPKAVSFVNWLAETHSIEMSAEDVQTVLSFHDDHQRWVNIPGGEADQRRASAGAAREAAETAKLLADEGKLRAALAKVDAAKKAQKVSA